MAMQRCVITRHFSHVPVTLLRTECLYGAIRRSILSLYYILLLVLVLLLNLNAHSNMVGVTTTPTNYVTFFTDYASNNARKNFTYYAGSSARILAASLHSIVLE